MPRFGLDSQAERDGFYADMHDLGKTVVYEIDDDLINMPPTNPAAFMSAHPEAVHDMIVRADLVTASTYHLANRLHALNSDTTMLPNCIDPDPANSRKSGSARSRPDDRHTRLDIASSMERVFPRSSERHTASTSRSALDVGGTGDSNRGHFGRALSITGE